VQISQKGSVQTSSKSITVCTAGFSTPVTGSHSTKSRVDMLAVGLGSFARSSRRRHAKSDSRHLRILRQSAPRNAPMHMVGASWGAWRVVYGTGSPWFLKVKLSR